MKMNMSLYKKEDETSTQVPLGYIFTVNFQSLDEMNFTFLYRNCPFIVFSYLLYSYLSYVYRGVFAK